LAAYCFGEQTTYESANKFLFDQTGLNLKENLDEFVHDVCGIDVLFTLKMISINSNQLALRDIFNSLWFQYLNLDKEKSGNLCQRPQRPFTRQKKCTADEDDM
jgi:hypothetical protein